MCSVREKNTHHLSVPTHILTFKNLMKKPLDTVLDAIDDEDIKKIINGLDLLDEYYTTEMEYNKVLDTRALKDTIRNHIPKNLIN